MKKQGNSSSHKQTFAFSSMLEELGIENGMFEALKPMLPKLIIELLRGLPKFVEEERRTQQLMRDSINDKGGKLLQNIYSIRNILLTFMGFSLTIIGGTLSVFSANKQIFIHVWILNVGLFLLSLNVIGSIIYLLYVHTIENNRLYRHLNFDLEVTNKLRELLITNLLDQSKTFDNYLVEKKTYLETKKDEEVDITGQNKKRKRDWWAHILSAFFALGTLSIIIFYYWH